MNSYHDRFFPCQFAAGLPSITTFSIQGIECVVFDSNACDGERLEIVGALAIRGQKYVIARSSNIPPGDDALAVLSPRELEIARCIAAGYQTKTIALRLRISYHTVRVHVGRIYGKLGLHKQTELASWISEHYGKRRLDV